MGLNWLKIREEYESGNTDADILADMFGCKSSTIREKIRSEKWENTLEEGRKKRIRIFKAVQNVALRGIEKADSMLDECGNVKELETHSKAVKTFRDVGMIKPEEVIGGVRTNNVLDDMFDISLEDAARVLGDDED